MHGGASNIYYGNFLSDNDVGAKDHYEEQSYASAEIKDDGNGDIDDPLLVIWEFSSPLFRRLCIELDTGDI